MYDVVIVGARCAGSPLAQRLARAGRRVLLLDRATLPSDTLSTHFLWPRGVSYLERLGVAEKVLAITPSATTINFTLDGTSFDTETPLEILRERFQYVHGDSEGVTDRYVCIRRRLLDGILLAAAIEAGAEFRSGVRVTGVLKDPQGKVSGVEAETAGGGKLFIPAKAVVGADGRRSVIATSVGAAESDVHPGGTVAYWSYYRGLGEIAPTLRKQGRLAMAIVPTNFDCHMVLVWGPQSERALFKADLEGQFLRHLHAVAPELGARVASRGERAEGFQGTAEQTAYRRQSAGDGWLLAGDAASFKDQCVAIGITHALRDAELAAEALHRGLAGDLNKELRAYAARREADLAGHFEFACQQARMEANTPQQNEFFARVAADQAAGNRFMAMYGDALPVDEFFESFASEVNNESREVSASA